MSTHPTICRFCHAGCGILVDVEDGRPVRATGDRANSAYRGYICSKGRQLPAQWAHPGRLLHSLKRGADGMHRPIASSQAMDEVAQRVAAIVDAHGPRSVALYIGTFAGSHPTAGAAGVGWLLGLGSRMVFTAASIDQPGKNIAYALHGRWLGGPYLLDEADTWLIVGANPVLSMTGGFSPANPGLRLREARRRGLALIAVDPRRTEVARRADIHLQVRPGEDPTLLAAMLNVIVRERLCDEAFLEQSAAGLDALAEAVSPFDPAYAELRTGVPADAIARAARTFAGGRKGCATAGTGPNMACRGNLTEYLLLCLNTLCGYWRREGEALPNPGVLMPRAIPVARASPPRRAWGFGEKLRVRGLASAASGLPTAALADEILLEGDGQVRALVCVGGNPVTAWPDQRKTLAALEALELCVTLDIRMSATAQRSDYVIAPKHSLEVPGLSLGVEAYDQSYLAIGYPEPYAQYAPALVEPPAGSDVLEEWEFFYGLCRRMGVDLRLRPIRAEAGPLREERKPIDLDMDHMPTSDLIFEQMTRSSCVPLCEVRKHPHGAVFDAEPVRVAAAEPGADARLELGDATMLAELAELRGEPLPAAATGARERFPFRLICRRLPNVYNSSGRDLPALTRRRAYNPAFMHPEDLEALGLEAGDVVTLSSDHGSILGIVEKAPDLRRGVVSMAHAFGDAPERAASVREVGSNTGRLISVERDYDPYTGIPRMSAIPVAVERFSGRVA